MKAAAVLFVVAALAGLLTPPPRRAAPGEIGPYRVLVCDFHLHMFPLDDSILAPWDVVLEARRRGLDVIALTGHNQVWTAKVGRWFARLSGRPLVLVGEEIITHPYDLIAIGIEKTIDWHGTPAESIAAIHQQGGIAIAPHPVRHYWSVYDDAAMRSLDGAEVMHPLALLYPGEAADLREFYARKPLAAIGSTDFHVTGYPGFVRTYVFTREVSESAVLDALREHRTVVVDHEGRTFGDPELIRLAQASGGLPRSGIEEPPDAWSQVSRWSALAGMLLVVIYGFNLTGRREQAGL